MQLKILISQLCPTSSAALIISYDCPLYGTFKLEKLWTVSL